MNANEVNDVNKVNEESTVNEVNVNEVNANEVNADEMNEESTMNEDSVEVCGVKEEMSKGKSLEIEAKVEVNKKSEEVVMAKPPKVPQRFDFAPKVQVEEFGMEEVKKLEDEEEVKEESRHGSWDPGELVNAKAHMEMFNVKVEVMQRGDVTTKALCDAAALYHFVRLYTSEVLVLVAQNAVRFVIVSPMSSRTFAESFLPHL